MSTPTADLPEWRRPLPIPEGAGSFPASLTPVDPDWSMTWDEHQDWERAWWGDCVNTFGEEAKQLTYAQRMGLVNEPRDGQWPVYDLGGRSVLDIGGGPCSILLKCVNGGRSIVADPCPYPGWVEDRYNAASFSIGFARVPGETLCAMSFPYAGVMAHGQMFDEVWIYNVLQHTQDPELIIGNARRMAPLVRLFEWIDTPAVPGHPHTLRAADLSRWLGAEGTVEVMNGENGCGGLAFYGAFPQNHHRPPSITDGTIAQGLLDGLQYLMDEYGPAGVADTVEQMRARQS